MGFTFDPAKNAKTIAERGLSFDLVEQFEWETALIIEDTRRPYGETRLQILACFEGRLYAAVVTPRGPDVRIISLRHANKREIARHAQQAR